jgi:hypothetical protein
LHRRFVTALTIEECRARATRIFAPFDRFGTPRTHDALFGDIAGGRLTDEGFVMNLRGKP